MNTLAPRVLVASLALALAGCSGGSGSGVPSSTHGEHDAGPSSGAGESPADAEEAAVTLTDGWVKATDTDMTGLFGTLENHSDHDVTLVKGSSDAAGTVELHEVAQGTMRPAEGGMTVPAGGSLRLEPGGLHIMLMQLTGEVVAGDSVEVVLRDAEGTEYPLTAEARTFDGGGEKYSGGDGHDHGHSH